MFYLFILGSYFELSRAELKNFAEEVFIDPEKSLLLAKNLKFKNPRNLPKTPEQIFLDRLGGTVRFGKLIPINASSSDLTEDFEFFDQKKIFSRIWEVLVAEKISKVGFSVYGGGKNLLLELMDETRKHFAKTGEKIRIENYNGKNCTSGQIFERRILQKGKEFVVWKNKNSFLLAETVANQNLRNYVLRDREKNFRDSKMGMLPPKLAQILINLATPNEKEIIIDPFCGSGTVNIEAAISGYKTIGTDINPEYVRKTQENFFQMAEKFRYPADSGVFLATDAINLTLPASFDSDEFSFVIATEGFLGKNFESTPNLSEIEKNAAEVLLLWENFFKHLVRLPKIKKISFCLPCWNFRGKRISLSEELFRKITPLHFSSQKVFDGENTYIYEREGAFVAREICVVHKEQ